MTQISGGGRLHSVLVARQLTDVNVFRVYYYVVKYFGSQFLFASMVFWASAGIADSSPTFDLAWGYQGTVSGAFRHPVGMCVDDNGNVYVVDRDNHRIQRFSPNGSFVMAWGDSGTGDGQFRSPDAIATSGLAVFVADFANNRVQKFTPNGAFLSKWGTFGSGNGQFQLPSGVAADQFGFVYVADMNNHRIQKFTSSGTFATKWGEFGQAPGELFKPTGVCVDGIGNVYVADWGNNRIQKFDGNGVFLSQVGEFGSGNGQFWGPQDVYVDFTSGSMYVADTNNNRIQRLTTDGAFVSKWGSQGSAPGQFSLPFSVATDPASQFVYVSDNDNHRIQRFSYLATDVSTPPPSTLSLTVRPNPFSHHTVVSYVLPSMSRHELAVFDVKGTRVRTLHHTGETHGVHSLSWSGDDDYGHPLASGVYFVRIRFGGIEESRKVLILR